ncbi:MAG: type II secretion system protein [Clostridia bacterium]|nr:type II secretion system protein [Clostridia bacterium]
MRKQRGITLLALSITIIVLLILTTTFTYNIDSYVDNKKRGDITADLQRVSEKISNYYAINKQLPILNKYTNTENIQDVITSNDNNNYYVIDLEKIGGADGLGLVYGVKRI